MEGARTATGMRGEGLGSAEYKNSMVAGTLPQYFVTMSREPRCSIPCSALNILPRLSPADGDGKQHVWSSDRKFLGLEKRHKDSRY